MKIVSLLLKAEILHQLRLVIYLIIYRVLYIPGGCLGFLNHQQHHCVLESNFISHKYIYIYILVCILTYLRSGIVDKEKNTGSLYTTTSKHCTVLCLFVVLRLQCKRLLCKCLLYLSWQLNWENIVFWVSIPGDQETNQSSKIHVPFD